ncbi:phosphatidic acid phosphatase type 2/haloperoxidase [Aspergillus germanicus]
MGKPVEGQPDAGLRSLDHYKNQLPHWRYWPRQKLLPLIRYETPYLAWFQEKIRTPALDSYFAFTANLGTHTFFMVFLPILFWSGFPSLGRAMVHMLASGIFFSGFIKDLLCLPRPLSPPLQRITMSGSAALEYGFPSSHSTNAVSVAVYILHLLKSPESTLSPDVTLFLQVVTYLYVASIVVGRLYCGMHGFFDVIIGSALGVLLAVLHCTFESEIDQYVHSGSGKQVTLVVLIILALVRIHPEPADDCPCFDDSVAFAAVTIGAQIAYWNIARADATWNTPHPSSLPRSTYEKISWAQMGLRLVIGVFLIFAWREIMKPSLLRILPPVFRGLEKLGLILPRRFFTKASQYTTVPAQLKDHDVLPSFSDIPGIITNIRHPRRRAVSIGPQSEADAYETLAYREKRRRDSLSSPYRGSPATDAISEEGSSSGAAVHRLSRKPSKLDEYENMMGTGTNAIEVASQSSGMEPFPEFIDEHDEEKLFAQVKRPRVRYDVEVVTKLVVYCGIAWIAIDGAAVLFELIGLMPS